MQPIKIDGISEQLSRAKGEKAGLIKNLLETQDTAEPSEDRCKAHFLSKHYFYADNLTDEPDVSRYELEEMFFELTDRALFASYCGDVSSAQKHFKTAQVIAEQLNNSFLKEQFKFLQTVSVDEVKLKKKLKCDCAYERINKMLAKSPNDAQQMISLTRSIAQEIGDKKRELDAMIKVLYLTYSSGDETVFPAGISLSHYIQQQEPEYEISTIWALYHEGNINIALGNNQRKAENAEQAREYFLAAKSCFEKALELAIKSEFDYATMILHERIGLVNNRLELFNIAHANYMESLNIGEYDGIRKEWLVLKNRLRCLIGLGNVYLDCSGIAGNDKETQLSKADNYFKNALELAQQINDSTNEKVALESLKEVCEARGKEDEKKCLHQLD